jgi:hypothetical protein
MDHVARGEPNALIPTKIDPDGAVYPKGHDDAADGCGFDRGTPDQRGVLWEQKREEKRGESEGDPPRRRRSTGHAR